MGLLKGYELQFSRGVKADIQFQWQLYGRQNEMMTVSEVPSAVIAAF